MVSEKQLAEAIASLEKRLRDNPPIEKKYLNSEEAAEYLGLAKTAMATLRRVGDGPVYSRPTWRMVFYTREAIDAWLAKCEERRDPNAHRSPGDATPGERGLV